MKYIKYVCLLVIILSAIGFFVQEDVVGQSIPSAMPDRPIYEYFPSSLVCSEVSVGVGPTAGAITIGETTIDELVETYSQLLLVEFEYVDAFDATLITLRNIDDDAIFRRFEACIFNEVISVVNGRLPTRLEIIRQFNQTEANNIPSMFRNHNVYDLVDEYGMPDSVTFSPNPTHRIVFWFEEGVAAEIYIRKDTADDEISASFGIISQIIYYPFQKSDNYEDVWPYKFTYIQEIFVDEDVPTEQNPFDFGSLIGTIPVQPSRTPAGTP